MISYAIVSIGDKAFQGKREDKSGAIIKEMLKERAHLAFYEMIPDEKDIIIYNQV